jgi:hypothetical protein
VKVFLLNIDYRYKNILNDDYESEVYLSLERAVAEGKYFLSQRCNKKGFKNYVFTVTETDPEYAQEFDVEKLGIDSHHKEDIRKYEPTHIVYFYNMDGILQSKYYRYMNKQREHFTGFTVLPEDESVLELGLQKKE